MSKRSTNSKGDDKPRLRRTGSKLLSRLRRRSKHENELPNQIAEKPIKIDRPNYDQHSKSESLKSSKSSETVVSGHTVLSERRSDQSLGSTTSGVPPIQEEEPVPCETSRKPTILQYPILSETSSTESSVPGEPSLSGEPISGESGPIKMPRERTIVSNTANTIVETARTFTSPLRDLESLEYSPLTQDYVAKARLMKQQPRPLENLPVYHSYDYRFSTSSLSHLVSRGIRPNGTLHGTSMRRDATSLVWRINSTTNLEEKSRSSSEIHKLVPWEAAKHITSTTIATSESVERPKPKRILTLTSATESDFESDASSEDGLLTMVSQEQSHLTQRSDDPWYTERTFVGEEEKEEEVHMGELMVKDKIVGALDWVLGFSGDSEERLSKQDKKKKRDEAESSLDVAWCLGLVSGLL